jgi:exopolysaccharide production protein ExoZ
MKTVDDGHLSESEDSSKLSRRPRNQSLQVVRALAALSVLLYHAALFTAERTSTVSITNFVGPSFGFYGVVTFFVLSGFLMEESIRRYPTKVFAAHRLLRLFPTYLAMYCIYAFVQFLRGGEFEKVPWLALTLLPVGTVHRPLHVEWTLVYELFFYAVCGLLCLRPRLHLVTSLFWALIVSYTYYFGGQYGTAFQPSFPGIVFSSWTLGFIIGGLGGHLRRVRVQPSPAMWFLIGAVLVGGLGLCSISGRMLVAPLGITALVIGLAQYQGSRELGLFGQVLFLIGECSYGIYLAHAICIKFVLHHVPPSFLESPVGLFFAVVSFSLAVGIVFGLADVRMYQWFKYKVDARFLATRTQGSR